MVCVCECVLFFRIKLEANNNNNKKLSFCILAKFAVVVVDLDVDFDSHSTAKVSNFAFSAQYNKRSNNNNNVVDSVVQQFAQNIVSISDSGQRQLKKFRALLGAIINELPARLPPATLTQSVSLSVYLSLSFSVCLSLQLSSILGNSFHALPLGTRCCCQQDRSNSRRWRCRWQCHCTPRLAGTAWNCLGLPGTTWQCLAGNY